jgi:lipoprotein-anchoring transpeptidase ErfK/SrfK
MGKLKLGFGMKIENNWKILIATFSGLLLGFLAFFLFDYFSKKFAEKNYNATNTIIVINKENQRLSVYDVIDGKIKDYSVSTGENPGNKLMKGDLKTPEGVFPIIGIENAADWSYDFKDGKGPVLGAYGPHFIRLKVDDVNIFHNVDLDTNITGDNKFQGIGIHGTHLNDLIGKRASHGCIRMKNQDLNDLKQYLQAGTLVLIVPGKLDIQENMKPSIIIKDKNNR